MAAVTRRRIDSPRNAAVKRLLSLRERQHRDARGEFLIEGVREVERAAVGGWQLLELYLAPEAASPAAKRLAARLERDGVPVTELAAPAFERASGRQHPDFLLSVAAARMPRLSALRLTHEPLLLVLDGLEKPGNLGALLRVADGCGVDAVILTGAGTDPYNPNVIRASMGSVFTVPWSLATPEETVQLLSSMGIRLVATSPHAQRLHWDCDLKGPLAVVMGAEHEGLGDYWLHGSAELVRIPMHGRADSLNVATAGAVVLYEALRQRTT